MHRSFGLVDPNRWTLGKMIPRMAKSPDSRPGHRMPALAFVELLTKRSDLFEHRLMHEQIFCHIGDFRKYVY